LVSEAAASTVGSDPLGLDAAGAEAELVGVEEDGGGDPLELELLLPQPATQTATSAITMTVAELRRTKFAFMTRRASLFARQHPGILQESWHQTSGRLCDRDGWNAVSRRPSWPPGPA